MRCRPPPTVRMKRAWRRPPRSGAGVPWPPPRKARRNACAGRSGRHPLDIRLHDLFHHLPDLMEVERGQLSVARFTGGPEFLMVPLDAPHVHGQFLLLPRRIVLRRQGEQSGEQGQDGDKEGRVTHVGGKRKPRRIGASWAMPDSNQRPLPCRGSALNQLS